MWGKPGQSSSLFSTDVRGDRGLVDFGCLKCPARRPARWTDSKLVFTGLRSTRPQGFYSPSHHLDWYWVRLGILKSQPPPRFRAPAQLHPLAFTVAVLGLADRGDQDSRDLPTILPRWARGRLLQETWPAPHTCGEKASGTTSSPRPCPPLSDPQVTPVSGIPRAHLHTTAGSARPERAPWQARVQRCRRDSSCPAERLLRRAPGAAAPPAGLEDRIPAMHCPLSLCKPESWH